MEKKAPSPSKGYLKTYFTEDYRLIQKSALFLAVIGVIGHLLFYFVLQDVFDTWESLTLRSVAALLFLTLVLVPRQTKLNRWNVIHLETVLALVFPLLFNIYLFQNQCSTYWSASVIFSAFIYGLFSNPRRSLLLYPLSFIGAYWFVKQVYPTTTIDDDLLMKSLQINFPAYFIVFFISVVQSIINNAYSIIEYERFRSDSLLENILPESIAVRLKDKETVIADEFSNVSIVFMDIVNFTAYSSSVSADSVVEMLNDIYTRLDKVLKRHGLEKIKTIGDCYMAASGLPQKDLHHAQKVAAFAHEAMDDLEDYTTANGTSVRFRCGVDCGPVVAGVIGEYKFIYDVWGDAVNTAARMEQHCEPGRIQVTERFKDELAAEQAQLTNGTSEFKEHVLEERAAIDVKGKGTVQTFYLQLKKKMGPTS